MPNVDFYLIKETNITECYGFICRLVDKAYQQKHHVYIYINSAEEAKVLDDLLWTFRDTSFIPHGLQLETTTAEPVRIGFPNMDSHNHPEAPYDILINLTLDIPHFFNHYHRVLEIVPQDNIYKTSSRKKYKLYKEKDCELVTHDLTQPS
jgi:DNA polymerase-3 subunit chi